MSSSAIPYAFPSPFAHQQAWRLLRLLVPYFWICWNTFNGSSFYHFYTISSSSSPSLVSAPQAACWRRRALSSLCTSTDFFRILSRGHWAFVRFNTFRLLFRNSSVWRTVEWISHDFIKLFQQWTSIKHGSAHRGMTSWLLYFLSLFLIIRKWIRLRRGVSIFTIDFLLESSFLPKSKYAHQNFLDTGLTTIGGSQ